MAVNGHDRGDEPVPTSGPFAWSIEGTIQNAAAATDVVERVGVALRGGTGFNLNVRDASGKRQAFKVAAVKPVDAVMNARLRDLVVTLLQLAEGRAIAVAADAAHLSGQINALFREARAIIDDKPRIYIPGGL